MTQAPATTGPRELCVCWTASAAACHEGTLSHREQISRYHLEISQLCAILPAGPIYLVRIPCQSQSELQIVLIAFRDFNNKLLWDGTAVAVFHWRIHSSSTSWIEKPLKGLFLGLGQADLLPICVHALCDPFFYINSIPSISPWQLHPQLPASLLATQRILLPLCQTLRVMLCSFLVHSTVLISSEEARAGSNDRHPLEQRAGGRRQLPQCPGHG